MPDRVDIQSGHEREPAIIQPVKDFSGNQGALQTWVNGHSRETIGLIQQMVEIESPSDDARALNQFAEWFAGVAAPQFGLQITVTPGGHLLCRSGSDGGGQVLILGHYDTVWPIGTLKTMPYREHNGRLWGPGVLDMKGGIVIALMALRAVRELEIPTGGSFLLQLNADEEIGSRTSRALTEANAQASRCVLVVEPGTGLTGKLKTARKGVGSYRLRVTGQAAHAGVDFGAGASAILELSRQLLKIAAFTDLGQGTTVNPGVIAGGTRSNVIAAEASAEIDARVSRLSDASELDARLRALVPEDSRCRVEVSGGLNRPPMERSAAGAKLFARARELGRQIGIDVEESSTGGGSDGNFTAALGVPTLDGVGAVGEGAHAANESILIDRIADRITLLAGLLGSL